jgi:crotonobetainyl-CoA:carnitine CoA-transferase CaiB-like acyl-CoA transferase
MPNAPPYDMSRHSDADLLGIIVSENQNLALRGAALAEKELRDRRREDARDARQLTIAQAAARAATMAAWAAVAAAIGAIGQLVVAIVGSLLAQP